MTRDGSEPRFPQEERPASRFAQSAAERLADILNAIPGGVAIYRVSDIFETVYFSDGVPELSGYTAQEYEELIHRDAAEMTYHEDTEMVVAKAMEVIRTRQTAVFEFRKQHRSGHIVWVRVQVKWMGEDEGRPLLHCVFHNITDLKQAQLEMDHLVNSIPGGIASYRVEGERFVPTYFSDGVPQLSGHTRVEFARMVNRDAMAIIYETDRPRVLAAAKAAMESGEVLDISYRMRHKDGRLIWVHLNGRRMGPPGLTSRFYAVFTGISAETRMFQSLANETADGIYVIDRENYDLLYANESKAVFQAGEKSVGQKCYAALHGLSAPCPFCKLEQESDGVEHTMVVGERTYSTRVRLTDWNGIPAYTKFVRDVTDEIATRKEKERLEEYFQTVVNILPGGVAVVRFDPDGSSAPEFLSEGFAAMTGMTLEEAWDLYREDSMAGVHPDDREHIQRQLRDYVEGVTDRCELVYRLRMGAGGYLWVKNNLTLIRNEDGSSRVYASYHDMTQIRQEQDTMRRQYNELILQHYRTPGPNALLVGHCNISANRILELIDHTHSDLPRLFGMERERFFTGLSTLLVDEPARRAFLDSFLNAPSLAAYQRGETELSLRAFVKLPREERGRHVEFAISLVETPDTGEVTGILTVTDVTEQVVSEMLHRNLSVTSYDLVLDVDLHRDRYTVLSSNGEDDLQERGVHSPRIQHMVESQVLPKDKALVAECMEPTRMLQRLTEEGAYSFSYSIRRADGRTATKKLTVSATDLRLGRVCLARTDITDSVREQQRLLNVIAYTFELLGFIDVSQNRITLFARQTILEDLPPLVVENYRASLDRLAHYYHSAGSYDEAREQFSIETILRRLEESPQGYDFVLPYQGAEGARFKQVTVVWGDREHKTVCLMRTDVTDMLAAERNSQNALERALALAEEANQAKSDFLSSMSHDIRTPMNAIIGMTALAVAQMDDRARVEDCLRKISASSKHLLSLINDILDMSKIERGKINLNRVRIYLPEVVHQLTAMLAPQANDGDLHLCLETRDVEHPYFYGDPLRLNQILINLLGNAIKFTPPGGKVDFLAEELPPRDPGGRVRLRFTVSDTGVGIAPELLTHIFEPFTRSRRAENVEGTGLGLSITKGLVDLMEGTIGVESVVGKGTTFVVELEGDIAPAGEEVWPAQDTSTQTFDLTGRRFLVAEDNVINAEILCELLAMHGGETEVKTDGAQAVQAFRDAPPGTYDAILMDIQMPVMNGYEATRAIRRLERPDAAAIPIIAMTANAFAEDVQASMDAGMDRHVSKPIDVQVLWALLRELFPPEA